MIKLFQRLSNCCATCIGTYTAFTKGDITSCSKTTACQAFSDAQLAGQITIIGSVNQLASQCT